MKKFLLIIILLVFIGITPVLAVTFTYDYLGGMKVRVVTVGKEATINITRPYSSLSKSNSIYVSSSREASSIFFNQNISFGDTVPETKTFTISNLDLDKTYFFSLGSENRLSEFKTAKYYFTLNTNLTSGQYPISFFGDKDDQRELVLFLHATRPIWGSADWTRDSIPISLGKLTPGNSPYGDGIGYKDISAPNGNNGLWYFPALAAKKVDGTYELLFKKDAPVQFGTEQKIYTDPISILPNSGKVSFVGKIDTAKHPNFKDFKIKIEQSPSGPFSTDLVDAGPADKKFYESVTWSNDGTYKIEVGDLTGPLYYFRQIISAPKTTTSNGLSVAEVGKFNPEKGIVPTDAKSVESDFEKRSYRLLAPFPGLAVLLDPDLCQEMLKAKQAVPSLCTEEDPSGFNTFLNYMFKLLIGLSAVLLVLRIIFEGYQYVVTDVPFLKSSAKSKIGEASAGLLLALSAYLILNTINPTLVTNTINLKGLSLDIQNSDGQVYRLTQTQNLPGSKVFKRTQYYDLIKSTAAKPEYNFPHCLLQAAILRESQGVAGLVGHDENAASSGIKSRREFVSSGKKFSGEVFNTNPSLVSQRNFINNDHKQGSVYSASNPNAQDLGLDWRFSHGVGLFGVTFYPKGSSYGDYSKGIYVKSLKKTVFVKDILSDPNVDVAVAAEIMSAAYLECNKNIDQTYRVYGSGSCKGNNAFTNKETPIRVDLYNQCVAQDK